MNMKKPIETPEPPAPSGETYRLHQKFVRARLDKGWSQEDLAHVLVEYAQKVAERYGEDPKWSSLSRQVIYQWENMFRPQGEEVPENLKRRRATMSVFNYASWARALGLRLVMDVVPADDPGELVFLPPGLAELARQLRALPERHRLGIEAIVADLWRVYRDEHEPADAVETEGSAVAAQIAESWERLPPAVRRMITAALDADEEIEP